MCQDPWVLGLIDDDFWVIPRQNSGICTRVLTQTRWLTLWQDWQQQGDEVINQRPGENIAVRAIQDTAMARN